jgi:hypothetical protein
MSDNNSCGKSVFFQPWIGPNYKLGVNGKKVLVLGESLWCCEPYACSDANKCGDMTTRIVKKQIETRAQNTKSESNPYYTKVARLLTGGLAPY